jgi:flagellar assembly protein FliH
MSSSFDPLADRRTARARILRAGEGREVSPALVAVPLSGASGGGRVSIREQLDAAREEGYESGYRAGKEEAAQSVEAERAAKLSRLAETVERAVTGLEAARSDAVATAASEAVDLAFELAEAILQRELAASTSAAKEAIARAIELVPSGQDMVVRIHPDDALDPAELAALLPDVAVTVVADPAVEAGGCIVDVGPARIDAQIGTALERARALIDGHGVRTAQG